VKTVNGGGPRTFPGTRTLMGLAVAAGLIVGCANTDGTTASSAPPPSTAPTVADWDKYKKDKGGEIELESAPHADGSQIIRVLARRDAGKRLIDVAEFDGAGWTTGGQVMLASPDYDFSTSGPDIQFGDVTGDGQPDILVPLQAAQPIAVVISQDGGAWRALPVQGSDGQPFDPYVGINPRYAGGVLVSDEPLCQPSCAQGGTRSITWRYEDGMLKHS
jgi:hypothetical protein